MAGFPKQKRFAYTKNFSVNQILRNLQSYKLATGDVHSSQIAQVRDKYGDDEGKVYGALVLGTSQQVASGHDQQGAQSYKGRRKRKRYRKRKGGQKKPRSLEIEAELDSTSSSTPAHLQSDDHLTEGQDAGLLLPPSSSKTDHLGDIESTSTSVLSSLVNYSDSESSQSDSHDDGSPTHSSHSSSPTSGFEVPLSIKQLFEDREIDSNDIDKASTRATVGVDCESGSSDDEDLGYFQPASSESSNSSAENDKELCTGTAGDVMRHGAPVDKRWDDEKVKWLFSPSELSTYVCWKCNNVGHLPKDCTVTVDMSGGSLSSNKRIKKISSHLQSLYAPCREIKRRKQDQCIECGVHSNLVACLECGAVLCDGRGHLSSHLISNPSHNTLFSYKLGKLLKCCKPTCEVVNCYELYMCSHCLSKSFSQHYSMIHATWSRAGLKLIPNALCCEEHFEWHRMNCPNTSEEPVISQARLVEGDVISEFFF